MLIQKLLIYIYPYFLAYVKCSWAHTLSCCFIHRSFASNGHSEFIIYYYYYCGNAIVATSLIKTRTASIGIDFKKDHTVYLHYAADREFGLHKMKVIMPL